MLYKRIHKFDLCVQLAEVLHKEHRCYLITDSFRLPPSLRTNLLKNQLPKTKQESYRSSPQQTEKGL